MSGPIHPSFRRFGAALVLGACGASEARTEPAPPTVASPRVADATRASTLPKEEPKPDVPETPALALAFDGCKDLGVVAFQDDVYAFYGSRLARLDTNAAVAEPKDLRWSRKVQGRRSKIDVHLDRVLTARATSRDLFLTMDSAQSGPRVSYKTGLMRLTEAGAVAVPHPGIYNVFGAQSWGGDATLLWGIAAERDAFKLRTFEVVGQGGGAAPRIERAMAASGCPKTPSRENFVPFRMPDFELAPDGPVTLLGGCTKAVVSVYTQDNPDGTHVEVDAAPASGKLALDERGVGYVALSGDPVRVLRWSGQLATPVADPGIAGDVTFAALDEHGQPWLAIGEEVIHRSDSGWTRETPLAGQTVAGLDGVGVDGPWVRLSDFGLRRRASDGTWAEITLPAGEETSRAQRVTVVGPGDVFIVGYRESAGAPINSGVLGGPRPATMHTTRPVAAPHRCEG